MCVCVLGVDDRAAVSLSVPWAQKEDVEGAGSLCTSHCSSQERRTSWTRTERTGEAGSAAGLLASWGWQGQAGVHGKVMTCLRRALLEFGRQRLTGVCWEPENGCVNLARPQVEQLLIARPSLLETALPETPGMSLPAALMVLNL